jgi:bifunctional non-homologous end joining protein LigD
MDVSFRTCVFLLKWDGFRTIAETDGTNGVKLYSRNQKDFKKRFSPIADALAKLKKAAILDGELVALDEHGHPRFEWLLNRGPQKGTLVYYVFDLLKLGDVELRSEPLRRRKKLLEKFLKGNPRLLYVEHVEREGLAMFAGALALGVEGIVAKDAKSPYVEGPRVTWHWQKIKNRDYQRQEKIEFHPRKAR